MITAAQFTNKPLNLVSGKNIKQGTVGDVTRNIHKLYWDKHSDPVWSTSINDLLLATS